MISSTILVNIAEGLIALLILLYQDSDAVASVYGQMIKNSRAEWFF